MCMTFQLNKMPFLALELPQFLAFDKNQWGKHRGHHWKKRLRISKSLYGGGKVSAPPPHHTNVCKTSESKIQSKLNELMPLTTF